MKSKKSKILSLPNIFSFCATIIAVVSLAISIKTCSISEKSLDINLNPIVTTDFYCNVTKEIFLLKIYNDGPVAIDEIKITRDFPVYNLLDISKTGGVRSGRYWWEYARLEPGDSIQINIPYEWIEYLPRYVKGYKEFNENIEDKYLIGAILFKISYRKEPEKNKYYLRKYLFSATINSKRAAYDPELNDSHDYRVLMRSINKFESSKNWLNEIQFD